MRTHHSRTRRRCQLVGGWLLLVTATQQASGAWTNHALGLLSPRSRTRSPQPFQRHLPPPPLQPPLFDAAAFVPEQRQEPELELAGITSTEDPPDFDLLEDQRLSWKEPSPQDKDDDDDDVQQPQPPPGGLTNTNLLPVYTDDEYEEEQRRVDDEKYMRMAIQLAQSAGDSAYPQPPVGAVLVDTAANDGTGKVWGRASANYRQEAVRTCLEEAGLEITPLREWLVAWPASSTLRDALKTSTLYITLEPSKERQGQALPSVTQLIQQSGVRRVVIGCTDPVPEKAGKGAAALHASGLQVRLLCVTSSSLSSSMALLSSSSGASDDNDNNHGSASGSGETASIYQLQHDCQELIRDYSHLANSKLHIQARKHYQLFGRPLGFLHCSVVDSDNLEAFARHGNAFGTKFGGKTLSFRNFGAYEIAPPPEVIWVNDDTASMMTSMDDYDALDVDSEDEDYDNDLDDNLISVDFEDEDYQGDIAASPMMPWYEQVNAVVATFPRPGNGPANDASISARLNGLKWLVSQGRQLPQGVERILVMDATDLKDLPLTNAQFAQVLGLSSSSSSGVGAGGLLDVESFWRADDRKPTRVLLRRGAHAQARAAAEAAAVAAQAAANAAMEAAEALESGDAARAAEAALDLERVARAETEYIQTQLQTLQTLRGRLEDLGVIVETINGGEPVDVMKHLGDRNGYQTVVWRAGCWGDRGVKSILAGAFQWVSAHLAVDAVGGKFWQLMLAENAVQAACGPVSKVKVFADQEDISLEYCDNPNVDTDCNLTIDGRPVRHIRLDCRIALVDENRPREFVIAKTKKIDRKIIEEEAPWFL